MDNQSLVQLGSETAKAGFQNEQDVVNHFNDWKRDKYAQAWLNEMGYDLKEIEYVLADKISGSYKADVQVQISIKIKLKTQIDVQNLQVKLVSNPTGFNQIDKRWVEKYVELWNIDSDVAKLLKYFTGENKPYKKGTKDCRRMFLFEFTDLERKKIIDFFDKNKTMIVSDILKGRGRFAAEWFLVILKNKDKEFAWALKPINYVLNYYGNGPVRMTLQGSIAIGKITVQRKGGDNGRDTANMLQFKINPAAILNIE